MLTFSFELCSQKAFNSYWDYCDYLHLFIFTLNCLSNISLMMLVSLPLVSLHYCGRNQVYLDPVILLIKVQGGVVLVAGLSAEIFFSGL